MARIARSVRYLSFLSQVPYILFLLVNTRITQYVALRHRLIWPLVACIFLFVVVTALVEVNTDNGNSML